MAKFCFRIAENKYFGISVLFFSITECCGCVTGVRIMDCTVNTTVQDALTSDFTANFADLSLGSQSVRFVLVLKTHWIQHFDGNYTSVQIGMEPGGGM
jgi:hypothetical protein